MCTRLSQRLLYDSDNCDLCRNGNYLQIRCFFRRTHANGLVGTAWYCEVKAWQHLDVEQQDSPYWEEIRRLSSADPKYIHKK